MTDGHITHLYIYPVKSCAAIDLKEANCDEQGLRHDREWAIVDHNGNVLTQRDNPRMALIEPDLDNNGSLILHARNYRSLTVTNIMPEEPKLQVRLWGDECSALDEGTDASVWLTELLQMQCRLVRHDGKSVRKSRYGKGSGGETTVAFADCCPLLLMSQESLDDLNERLSEPVPMSRFRPSIVTRGFGKYREDHIEKLSTGETVLSSVKPCARCVIVTIDQEDGIAKGPEPLQTLSRYRICDGKVLFGQYFKAEQPGRLRAGNVLSQLRC